MWHLHNIPTSPNYIKINRFYIYKNNQYKKLLEMYIWMPSLRNNI